MNIGLDLQRIPRKFSFLISIYVSSDDSKRKAMNRNWYNQKAKDCTQPLRIGNIRASNMPRAMSVRVSFGRSCANFIQNLWATANFNIDARLTFDHNSQPKSARGRTTDV